MWSRTLRASTGTMWSVYPLPGAAGLWQPPSASHSPLPPSAREVCTQLYWSIVSVTVAVSKSRSIGCRGTVTAAPTRRLSSSTDESAPTVLAGDQLGRVDRQPVAPGEPDVAVDLRLDGPAAGVAGPAQDRQPRARPRRRRGVADAAEVEVR